MTIKHIAHYRAEHTGNTVEEENNLLKLRAKSKNENLFKVSSYEKYLWLKSNNKLREEW